MIAKKMNIDKMIDVAMTKLFQLAEYVCDKFHIASSETAAPASPSVSAEVPKMAVTPKMAVAPEVQPTIVPTIRFSQEDKMVEGNLFDN